MKNDYNRESCFVGDVQDEDWIWIIRHRVVDWVKLQTIKNRWAMVMYYSQRKGVIKPKLSVRLFAELIYDLCPDALGDVKPVTRLASAISSYHLPADVDTLKADDIRRLHYEELDELFRSISNSTGTGAFRRRRMAAR